MHPNRRALTITEVIVAASIISLLLGLLLPALGSMKTAARRAHCQANLRQMSLAAQTYSTLWDAYPAAIRYEQVNGVAHRIAWDWVTTFSGQVISPGPLWQYTDNPDRAMQCPGYHGPANYNGDAFTGYNYNTDYIGGEAVTVAFGWDVVRRGARPGSCRMPAQTAIFGLGGYSGGANKFMRAPVSPHGISPWITYSGGQARRYGNATNVAYIDGHVASVQTLYDGPQSDQSLLDQLDVPNNGFLSDDDAAYNPKATPNGGGSS